MIPSFDDVRAAVVCAFHDERVAEAGWAADGTLAHPTGAWQWIEANQVDVVISNWNELFDVFATAKMRLPEDIAFASLDVPPSMAGSMICGLTVTTDIAHTFAADLDITLTSPTGTVVTLTTDNGAGNDNVFAGTVWSDKANPAGQVPYTTNNGLVTDHAYVNLTAATPLVPEEPLGAFTGEVYAGTWTLTVSDDLMGDTGTLNSWSLTIGRCIR